MLRNLCSVFSFIFILFITGPILSQKVEKASLKVFSATEKYYLTGEYKKAISMLEKLEKKVSKYEKTGKSPYSTLIEIKKAKYNEAYGVFTQMDSIVDASLKEITKLSNDPFMVAKAHKEVCDIYYSYGLYKKADGYLKKIESIKNIEYETDFYVQVLVRRFEVDLVRGKFSEIHKNSANALSFIDKTFSKKYEVKSLVDETIESKKRAKATIEANLIAYSDILNIELAAYVNSGNYAAVDTLKEKVETWIRKEGLGKSSISYVNTLLVLSDYYKFTQKKKESRKALGRALVVAEKAKGYKLKPYSKKYIEIYEKLYDMLVSLDEKNNYRKLKSEIEPLIARYYPRKSFVTYQLDLLQTQKDFHNYNYEKSYSEVKDLFIDKSFYFPSDHPIRAKYFSRYVDKYPYIENKSLYEDNYKTYKKLLAEIYDTTDVSYHLNEIEEAVHKIINKNEYDKAKDIYEKSFDNLLVNEIHPMHRDYQKWINTRAYAYESLDKLEEAEGILLSYDRKVDRYYGRFSLQKGVSLQKIGDLYIKKGLYDTADGSLKIAEHIYDEIKEERNINYMYTLLSRAKLYMVQGDYDQAEKILDKALKVAKRNNLESEFNIEEFASLYIKQGKFHKVDKLLQESLANKKSKYGTGHQSLIDTYRLLGEINLINGNYTQSEKYLSQSEDICVTILGRESLKYTEVQEIHANLYEEIGNIETAEFSFKDVLEVKKGILGDGHISVAKTLNNLAIVQFLNKRSQDTVESHFNQALKIVTKNLGDNNPLYASILIDKAKYYAEIGSLDQADKLLNKADIIWASNSQLGKNNIHSAKITMHRAAIARKRGQYSKSLELYEDAARMYKKIFSDRHMDYVHALSQTAQIQYILGNVFEANDILQATTDQYLLFIRKFFPALSEREKSNFWSKVKGDFEFYNTVAFNNEKTNPGMIAQVYNNVLATKAILLSSSIKIRKSIQSSGDTSLINKYDDWVTKREYFTSVAGFSDEQLKEQGIDFGLLEKEIEDLEKYLSENSDVFKSGNEDYLVDWRSIKDQLVENEYAVEIIRYRHFDKEFTDSIAYAALVINENTKRAPQLIRFPEGHKFESKYIKYFRNSIKFRVDDKWSYGALWKPMESVIPAGARVYLSPEGVYNQLNPEAIRLENGEFLLDRNEFVLVSNTKDLLNREMHSDDKEKIKKRTAILMGNPAFYNVRALNDSILITRDDSVYANEYDKVLVTADDNVTASYRDGVRVWERDKVITSAQDNVIIKEKDKVLAHEEDKVFLTASDNVYKNIGPGGEKKLVSLEDSVYATIRDGIFITEEDNIIARNYHNRFIQDDDGIWAEERHGKIITELDSVFAREEHKVLITKDDKIVNHSVYDNFTVSQLPGAETEIKTLSKLLQKNKWDVQDYLFEDATEDTIKLFKSPDVLHIATHGFFASDAKQSQDVTGFQKALTANNALLKSGLILKHGGDIVDNSNVFDYNLEGGILTAYEAMSLNFDNTELVVLSACETGLGEVQVGEGVYGLQRSFFVSGAKSVIMSLFKVSDEATLKLMNLFYENWIDGMDKRRAFVEAKKELRNEYKDPIYWGAFIMIGA